MFLFIAFLLQSVCINFQFSLFLTLQSSSLFFLLLRNFILRRRKSLCAKLWVYVYFALYLFTLSLSHSLSYYYSYSFGTMHFSSWLPFLSPFALNVQKRLWRPVTRSIFTAYRSWLTELHPYSYSYSYFSEPLERSTTSFSTSFRHETLPFMHEATIQRRI